jgi:hypothetical protein
MTSGSLAVGRVLDKCQVNCKTKRGTLVLQVRDLGFGDINPILIKETHVMNSQSMLEEHSLGSEGLNCALVP